MNEKSHTFPNCIGTLCLELLVNTLILDNPLIKLLEVAKII